MPINKFITNLDLARQAEIYSGETAVFQGGMKMGIPFSGFPSGVDESTSVSIGVTGTDSATFSGSSATTIFDVTNLTSPYYNPTSETLRNIPYTQLDISTENIIISAATYSPLLLSYTANTGISNDPINLIWGNTLLEKLYSVSITGETQPNNIFEVLFDNIGAAIVGNVIQLNETEYYQSESSNSIFSGAQFTMQIYEQGVHGSFPTLVTGTTSGTVSEYSATTFHWENVEYLTGVSGLTLPITPLSSETQITDVVWTLTDSTIIDGNVIGLQYTGYNYTYSFDSVTDVSTGTTPEYHGVVTVFREDFSAGTLDYKGDLTWLNVRGNTNVEQKITTKQLVVTENPVVGYVLTSDSEGMATWQSVSAVTSGVTFWEEDGTGNTALKDDKGGHTINGVSDNSIIAGGSGNVLDGVARSVILGGSGITATTDDTVYMPDFWISNPSNDVNIYTNTSSTTGLYQVISAKTDSLIRLSLVDGSGSGLNIGTRGTTEASYASFGKQGDTFYYAGADANGLNLINQAGVGKDDYIRFYAGQDATSTSHMHIQGSGATKGYVGFNNENPTERLDVVGNGKFSGTLNIGTVNSGASVSNLAIDVSGNVILGEDTDTLQTVDPYFDGGSLTAITWDVSGNSTNYEITITADTTLNLTNVRDGEYGTIWVEQGNNSGNTITFGTINGASGTHIVANGGGGSPTLTTGINNIDILTFTYNGNSNKMAWTVGNDYT